MTEAVLWTTGRGKLNGLVGGGSWGGQLGDKWKIQHTEYGPNWGAAGEMQSCVRTQIIPDSKGEVCRRVRDV